jgi:acetyl esterase/lipase
MKMLRALVYASALLTILPFVRPKGLAARPWIWVGKLLAGALAPLLGIVSGLGGLLGLMRRDWKLAGVGLAGAGLAAKFISAIPDSQGEFDAAFGPDWQASLTASPRPLPRSRRWSLLAGAPGGASWQRNVVYGRNPGTGTELFADVWGPPPGVRPSGLAAIYVHGGAWRVGGKDMGTRTFFRRLAAQGHVVMDIAYTLWPKADIPTMVGEVKQAVLWTKEHAGLIGVDPERIVLMGGSAGGHLALLAAYTPDHSALPPLSGTGDVSVRGVIAFYPPAEFLGWWEQFRAGVLGREGVELQRLADRAAEGCFARLFMLHSGDLEQDLAVRELLPSILGGSPDETPETYRLLSPISHVGLHCPPTLLLHGSEDVFALTPGVRRLHQSLRDAGACSLLVEFPHTDHAFDLVLPAVSPVAQAATYDVEQFLGLLV